MEIRTDRKSLGSASGCRVFIIHHMFRLNYSDLDEWANTRVTLYESSIFADNDDWADGKEPAKLLFKLQQFKFDPTKDYVVLSGDILRIATTCALIGRLYPKFCMLRYDRQLNGYWPFYVNLSQRTAS